MDWGAAYEEEKVSVRQELIDARREARYSKRTGARCQVYVPSKRRKISVEFITDNQIDEVAQFEAETSTQGAINRTKKRD